MAQKLKITDISTGITYTRHDNGFITCERSKDATNYPINILPVTNFGDFGIGYHERGYLIINSLTRTCYVFRHGSRHHYEYYGEKLFPAYYPYKRDIKNVSELINEALIYIEALEND